MYTGYVTDHKQFTTYSQTFKNRLCMSAPITATEDKQKKRVIGCLVGRQSSIINS